MPTPRASLTDITTVDEDLEPIVRVPLMTPSSAPAESVASRLAAAPAARNGKGREVAAGDQTGADPMERLAQNFQPKVTKEQINCRVSPDVRRLLDARVREFHARGFKINREVVIEDALRLYLGMPQVI